MLRQVLMDKEALGSTEVNADFGKPREPILVMTHLWRLFKAGAWEGRFVYQVEDDPLGQVPLAAPSVFNFFRPTFAPPGILARKGLVAPEMQVLNPPNIVQLHNELFVRVDYWRKDNPEADRREVRIDLSALQGRAEDPETLVDYLDGYLTGARLPSAFRSTLAAHLATLPMDDGRGPGTGRAVEALYLVLTSPYYLIQF